MAKDLLPYYKGLKAIGLYDWECQADQLIRQFVSNFDPENNVDHYAERVDVAIMMANVAEFGIYTHKDVINLILTGIAKKPYIQVVKD